MQYDIYSNRRIKCILQGQPECKGIAPAVLRPEWESVSQRGWEGRMEKGSEAEGIEYAGVEWQGQHVFATFWGLDIFVIKYMHIHMDMCICMYQKIVFLVCNYLSSIVQWFLLPISQMFLSSCTEALHLLDNCFLHLSKTPNNYYSTLHLHEPAFFKYLFSAGLYKIGHFVYGLFHLVISRSLYHMVYARFSFLLKVE